MINEISKILCSAGKLNHYISSGKWNQFSRILTPETQEIVVVTFAGKLNHVYSLLKPHLCPSNHFRLKDNYKHYKKFSYIAHCTLLKGEVQCKTFFQLVRRTHLTVSIFPRVPSYHAIIVLQPCTHLS